MHARFIRSVLGGVTLAASGAYTFVYLYRWEWNRALMSAAIFVAAEVAVMGSVLAERLKKIDKRLDAQDEREARLGSRGPARAAVEREMCVEARAARSEAAGAEGMSRRQRVERIRETAPPARVSFDWLARPQHMNVFVPVLMGAGVLMSGLAWVVERLARATVRPMAERGLAAQLDGLTLPAAGFLAGHEQPVDLLRGPAPATVGAGSMSRRLR
ncbi:MAG: hypothetical protein ACRD07_13835 [Acidimicrobiales bacterium]